MDAARVVREVRGRAGLTQRELARATGMFQPAIARIESGDVVPRIDTLVRVLAACRASLVVEPKPRDSDRLARIRDDTQALLREAPRQRLLSLPQRSGSRFRPIELIKTLAFRRVRFVLVGEVAARVRGAPVTPGVLDLAVQPERLNAERLSGAVNAMSHAPGRKKGLPTGLRDLRGKGRIRTRSGTIGVWWPTDETYRRLEGAATQMALATRPVLVASIDDVIDRWPRKGDELELLAAVREEMDVSAVRVRKRRR
jgi:transcriptional regulator with XRE-family HTH domain